MSALTDCQIKAMISRLDSAAELYAMQGKPGKARNSAQKAAHYRRELAARESGDAVQTPQRAWHGEYPGRKG